MMSKTCVVTYTLMIEVSYASVLPSNPGSARLRCFATAWSRMLTLFVPRGDDGHGFDSGSPFGSFVMTAS